MPHIPRTKLYYFNSDPDCKMNGEEFKQKGCALLGNAINDHLYTDGLRTLIQRVKFSLVSMHNKAWGNLIGNELPEREQVVKYVLQTKPGDTSMGAMLAALERTPDASILSYERVVGWALASVQQMQIKNIDAVTLELLGDLRRGAVSADLIVSILQTNARVVPRPLGNSNELEVGIVDVDEVPADPAAKPRDSDIGNDEKDDE